MCQLKYPPHLKLYPFQIETVQRTLSFMAKNKSHACYCANEMGLGKSITSLVTANTLGSKRILIICPAVMRLVWKSEIYVWCEPDSSVQVIETAADVFGVYCARYTVISYSLLINKQVLKELCSYDYDLLILDEAHAIKSKRSKRSRAVIADIWPKCACRLLLSGTPMTNSSVDLWIPFHNIMPEKFPTFAAFTERYSFMRITQWGVDFYGLKNAEELSKIIREGFYIRYRKQDVLPELPPKVWQKIPLPAEYSVKVSAAQAEKLYRESQSILDMMFNNKGIVVPPSLAEHRKLQGEMKVPAVVDFCKELLEQEIPIVVFGYHKSVMSSLKEALKEFNPVCITGETPSAERMQAINDFQEGKTNCFLGNIVASGVGCTLTRSTTVIFAEMSWSAAENDQAACRCHRIGTKGQVNIHWFVVQSSIDETILEAVIRKTKDFGAVCDAPSN